MQVIKLQTNVEATLKQFGNIEGLSLISLSAEVPDNLFKRLNPNTTKAASGAYEVINETGSIQGAIVGASKAALTELFTELAAGPTTLDTISIAGVSITFVDCVLAGLNIKPVEDSLSPMYSASFSYIFGYIKGGLGDPSHTPLQYVMTESLRD